MNKVILIGRLGKDPELRKLDNGNSVASFSMATSESYKNKAGEKVQDTQWHNLVAWGKSGEIISTYCQKGSHLCIEGKLTHRSYEDKDGLKKYITEVIVKEFEFLGKSSNENESTNNESDDLPF